MATVTGENYVFGIIENKPIRGLPEGRRRLRFRPDDFLRAYVKTANGLEGYYLKDEGSHYVAGICFSKNMTSL